MKRSKTVYRGGIAIVILLAVLLLLNYRLTKPLSGMLRSAETQLVSGRECPKSETCSPDPSLMHQLAELDNLREENNQLRNQLKFYKRVAYTQLSASVKSRDSFNSSLMYIDAGIDDGVQVGQAVTAGDGIMIGKVGQVTPGASLVELLTSDSTRLAVRTLNADKTEGLLRGHLGSTIRMEFVQANTSLSVGDVVTTSGLESHIPRGLVIGTIAKTEHDPNQLFTTADISPALDYAQITIVSVILAQ